MDLLASFSLLCDIPGFIDLITIDSDDSNRHLTLERMAKAAQAGARAARIMQVIALLQLLRLQAKRRGFGILRSTFSEDSSIQTRESDKNGKFQMTSAKPQSRVGEKLTEMTMRKVIIGVLILLSVLPVFDAEVFYGKPVLFEDAGLKSLHEMYGDSNNSTFSIAVEVCRCCSCSFGPVVMVS